MEGMKFFVTGAAGFIGSNFCDYLLNKGHKVVCFDNLSTGNEFFMQDALKDAKFRFINGDIQKFEEVQTALQETKPDWIIHLAANADVRRGFEHPRKDLDVNTLGTWNVLESARDAGVKKILFSSTSASYGEPAVFPTPEDAPFPEQTSLYGASKAAGEGLVSAYCHGYGMTGIVFRFVSIVGPRYTHGHIFDFVKKLKRNPQRLEILGDGEQIKSYLHVKDLMRGLWLTIEKVEDGSIDNAYSVFNIGNKSSIVLKNSATLIAEKMKLNPDFTFTGGKRGWVGDAPRVELATEKLEKLGWKAEYPLEQGITDTVDYLLAHSELLARA